MLGLRYGEHVDLLKVPLTDELRVMLAAQVKRVQGVEKKLGRVIPHLFPHLRGTRTLREGLRRRASVSGRRGAWGCSSTTCGARRCGRW